MQHDEPAGLDGDAGTLRHERFLAHAPERVWEAITSPVDIAQWMMASKASVDGRVGGRVEIHALLHMEGRVLAWDPPRRFELTLHIRTQPGQERDNAVVCYDLRPEGAGTRLTMTFRRLRPELARVFARGQPVVFDRLEAYLDGSTMLDPRPSASTPRDAAQGGT